MPDDRDFTTKGDLAKAMIQRALASPLPITWVTADSAYGQENGGGVGSGGSRRRLRPGRPEAPARPRAASASS
ncbi:hypothetical protein ACIOWI_34595 [Streptomyces sp. NPDC087659]|uniref:hypothetical protein n=1 Tax=Streptomyces sp. NPDC087659 TaxID=3365801 RepID=UPI0037F7D343